MKSLSCLCLPGIPVSHDPRASEVRGQARRCAETHIYATDLTLEDSGFNILLGTTLAGKTTLMQLMAGLERPTSGEVWFNGKNVTRVAVQKRNVSMVHQQFINYPNLSVFENIASPLRVAGVARGQIDQAGRAGRRAAEADAPAQAPAGRAFRRPAAAHGARPRPGQGSRPGAARRAPGQPRLQAARGAARRAAAPLRGPQLHRGLRHHASPARRCSWAATRRPCTRAG